MAFPRTTLPFRALIAPGADPVDPSTWQFTDISGDIREGNNTVQIQVGRQDEGSQVDATRVTATINNSSGNYSRVNPLGQWYGQLDKGTPLEVRITRIIDMFTRAVSPGWGTEPNSGLTWSHPSPSAWAATGTVGTCTLAVVNTAASALLTAAAGHDVEVRHVSSVPAVMTGAAWVDATMVRYVDANNFYRVHTEYTTSGTIGVKIVRVKDGVSTDLTSVISTGVTYAAGTRVATAVRAVGATLQVRCWLESGTEPTVWHAQVDDTEITGTSTGLWQWRVAGNTNPGSLTVSIDNFRMDVIRATTPVPEWPVRWGSVEEYASVPVIGGGPLRRLSQGQAALRSPMYRQISGYTRSLGHWPMEDASGATVLANTVPAGRAGTISGTSLGDTDGPPGALSVARSGSGSGMSAPFVTSPWADQGWQIAWSCKLGQTAPASHTEMFRWQSTGGFTWYWLVSSTSFRLQVAVDGAIVLDTTFSFGSYLPTQWLSYRVKVTELGGTVTAEAAWFGADGGTPLGITASWAAGGLGRLIGWRQVTTAATEGALWSHIFGVSTGTDDLQSYNARRAFDGYTGETAGNRLIRLGAEENVPVMVIGDPDDTTAMGAQAAGAWLEVARDCEAADQGVLHERGAGVGYLTRRARYNQAAAMSLDFALRHIASPPEPTDDDQRLRNRIKLSRTDGSGVTVEDEASILKNGAYVDELRVNLDNDSELEQHAAWRLHLGTQDGLRWPRIELNLATNPGLIADWCRVRVGSRIVIANPPSQVGTDDLELIVEGWLETFGNFQWDVVLNCSPAEPWDVGIYNDAARGRYDSRATTLSAGVSSSATTLVLTFPTLSDAWSRVAASQPYDLLIAGERIRVPVGGMGVITGSGPYTQTITGATRAINGISKAQVANAEVHVADPARYAL